MEEEGTIVFKYFVAYEEHYIFNTSKYNITLFDELDSLGSYCVPLEEPK